MNRIVGNRSLDWSSDLVSFFTRLGVYTACAHLAQGYILGYFLYLFLDLVIMDAYLYIRFGLKKLKAGLDSFFKDLGIINCFYVTLDRKMEDIIDLKAHLSHDSAGLERFSCNLVKILGKYYLRQLNGEELEREWHKCFITVEKPI
jgi:hypothetical protein